MTLFKDPTPRIERASRQTLGVLVSVVDEPGEDRVGYPAVVAFKGKNYGCYAFGDDLTAGDRVHFVEAGGQYWAIKAGAYYTTVYRKRLREWFKKYPASAAIARVMSKNRKKYQYEAGTVIATGGDTVTVKLNGKTGNRIFPVEFAGDLREIAVSDVGKRCLVYKKSNGSGAVLPSAAEEDEIHTGDEAGTDDRWPSDDQQSYEIGTGMPAAISRSGSGALALMWWDTVASQWKITSLQVYPPATYAVAGLARRQGPTSYNEERPVIACGNAFFWIGYESTSTSNFTRCIWKLDKTTASVTSIDIDDLTPLFLQPISDSAFSVLCYDEVDYKPGLISINADTGAVAELFSFSGAGAMSSRAAGLFGYSMKNGCFYGPNKRVFWSDSGLYDTPPTNVLQFMTAGDSAPVSVTAQTQNWFQELSDGKWFQVTGGGYFTGMGTGYQAGNKAGYNTACTDPVKARPDSDEFEDSAWFVRAHIWKGKAFAPRGRWHNWVSSYYPSWGSGCYAQILVYDFGANTWVDKTGSYVISGVFIGFADKGTDNCYYAISLDGSDIHVTRTKSLK